jgi:5-methylcytosine-specific restriction endonuclease McrA
MKQCRICGQSKDKTEFYKHNDTRDRLTHECKTCLSKQRRLRYEKNKYDETERQRLYKENNKDSIKAWHAANYIRNRERILARTRVWWSKNKERKRAKSSEWKRGNLDKITEYNNRRRALRTAASGNYTASESNDLLERQGHSCVACAADLRVTTKHLDHKTPLSRGGSNSIDNLQWLCEQCNLSKATRTNEEWGLT